MKTILLKILTRGSTLNPQNKVVCAALHQMGHTNVVSIQVERCAILEVDDADDLAEWKLRLGEDLRNGKLPSSLFNPVTDVFEIEGS